MARPVGSTCVIAATVALVVSACGRGGPFAPSPTPFAEEHMPSFASVDVVGDPVVATSDLVLELWILPENERLRTTTIPAGTVIRWSEGLSDGRIRLVARAEASCAQEVDLAPEQSTHVVLHHDGTACSFEVVDVAPPDEGAGLAARVTVKPWVGLLVEAVSLDAPAQPVPPAVAPDEGGLAQLPWLYPGRYEIRLTRGEAVLETQEIDVGDGPSTIELVFDGVPD